MQNRNRTESRNAAEFNLNSEQEGMKGLRMENVSGYIRMGQLRFRFVIGNEQSETEIHL